MIKDNIFKCIGFVELNQENIDDFKSSGFSIVKPDVQLSNFLESTYHSEYINIMFGDECQHLNKSINTSIHLNHLKKDVLMNKLDLYIFKSNLNSFTAVYSIDYVLDVDDVALFSDLSFNLKGHSTEITVNDKNYTLIDFISKNLFNGIILNDINSDLAQFSGNKFKHYAILDFEKIDFDLDNLLFELGTNSKVGSISSKSLDSPSEKYFNQILENKLSCFNNYSGLSLNDSFVVIGKNNYARENKYSHSTWDEIYFKIFIFNQFIKSTLQIISNSFSKEPVKSRNTFDKFFNTYFLNKISFNFLPNEIYKTIYTSLDIDDDIVFLRDKLNTLSNQLNETQQKQQEFLLLCLSILAALEIPLHIEGIRNIIGINNYVIYNSIIYPLIFITLLAIFIIKYLRRKNSK